MLTLAAPRSAPALWRLLALRLPDTSLVARSMALPSLVTLTDKAPSATVLLAPMVRVSGTSPSVRPAQVRLPLAAMAVANWLAEQSVGLAARAVAVAARSMVMELGISPSVRPAQVRLPLAAMAVANWLAEQSLGSAARALAVEALPIRAPLKDEAVMMPSRVRLVLKAPLVLPRLMVMSAAPRSAATLCKLLALRLPATSLVARSMALPSLVTLADRAPSATLPEALIVRSSSTSLFWILLPSLVTLADNEASVMEAQVRLPLAAMVVA